MIEADKKEKYEEDGKEKEEKYTNFEHLKAKVEVIEDELDLVTAILRQNNLVLKEEKQAGMKDISDETYRKLEEE